MGVGVGGCLRWCVGEDGVQLEKLLNNVSVKDVSLNDV